MKNLGSPKICMACMTTIEIGQNYVKHHVTYFPETIVNVHTRCHGLIHKTKKYINLLPDLRESLRWNRKKGYTYLYDNIDANEWVIQDFFESIENGFIDSKERNEFDGITKYWEQISRIKQIQQKLNIKQDWCSSDQIPS